MSDITKKFQDIMKDIENNISDEQQLQFVNKKITEISMLHMELIDEMADIIKNKIENLEKVQNSMDMKINKIQASIAGIENDIYEDGFDFEIVCPYCNNEFTADIESKSDIRCPECNNVIELDWNGEEASGCSGSCSSCSSRCGDSFFDDAEYECEEDEDEDDDM